MCNKTKHKNKKQFCKYYLQCFSSKKSCKYIKKSLKLKSGSIKFKNYFKQLAVPFKIYVDFESILKWIKRNNRKCNTSYTKKYQDRVPCSFAYKMVWSNDTFSKPLFFTEEKCSL